MRNKNRGIRNRTRYWRREKKKRDRHVQWMYPTAAEILDIAVSRRDCVLLDITEIIPVKVYYAKRT